MVSFSVHRLIDFPAQAIQHRFGGHNFNGHVREHKFNRLEIPNWLTKLNSIGRKVIRLFRGTYRGPHTTGSNTQTGLDEPVFSHFKTLTDLTQNLVVTDDHIVENEFWMLKGKAMGVHRCPLNLDTGQILINKENCGLRWITVHVGMDQNVVRDITDRNEPLLAVYFPATLDFIRTGLTLIRIGPCIGLGDGIGVSTASLTGRNQVFSFLFRGGKSHRIRGIPQSIPNRSSRLA